MPEPPEVPPNVEHVWHWFHDISSQRRTGPEALAWSEIEAWARLTATDLLPREAQMLIAMDRAYIRAVRKEQRENRERLQAESKAKTGARSRRPR